MVHGGPEGAAGGPDATRRGRLIAFEGADGAGKSTQIAAIGEALQARGLDIVATREPGGTPGAEAIRELLVSGPGDRWDPMSEALLHYAARREHLVHRVLPALAAGRWVLTDRFADSTMAYQGYAQGLGQAAVDRLHALAVDGLTPDLTLIFDLPGEAADRRRATRGGPGSRYERFDADFQATVRAAFRDIARRQADRCVLIDAAAAPAAVTAAALAAIDRRLGLP